MKLCGTMLFALLGGCFFLEIATPLTSGTSEWYYTGPVRKSPRELYDAISKTVRRQGFTINFRDPEHQRLDTKWVVQLSSHWREGYRTMLEVELVSEERGGTNVRVRAIRQINDNAKNPLIGSQAQWVPAGMDERQKQRIPLPALRLCQSLKLSFFGVTNG